MVAADLRLQIRNEIKNQEGIEHNVKLDDLHISNSDSNSSLNVPLSSLLKEAEEEEKEEHIHEDHHFNTTEGILKPPGLPLPLVMMDLQLYRAAIKGELGNFMKTLSSVSRDKGLSTTTILNQVTPLGNTVLHLAADLGHAYLAGYLACDFPHLLVSTNRRGDTPFIVAARSGQNVTVDNIIAYFSNNSPTYHRTSTGLCTILRMANEDGNTALHEALLNKNEDMVNFLLPRDKELPFLYSNRQGKTPLYITIETGQISLVRKMLQLLPDSGIKIAGKSPVNAAIKAMNTDMLVMICENIPSLMYTRDEDGGTPLHCAASVGYYKGVEFLLNRFTEFILKHNNHGLLPIHIASQKGHLEILKKLLHEFPDSKELVTSTMGENILHIASKFGRIGIVKYVLETPSLGVLINQKDDNWNTPLHLATRNCFPKVVSCLTWEKRVKLNLVNKDGTTALDIIEELGIIPPSYQKRLAWIALKAAGGESSKYLKTPYDYKLNQPNNQIIMNDTTTPSSRVDYKDRINTLLLVSTLVATVTFAAGFTMPGGYNNSTPDQGQATMLNKGAFQAFVICDTIAMYSATIVAVTLIWAQLGDLHLVLSSLRLALPLLGVSLSMMSTAFLAGVWLVISNLGWLSNLILIMGIVFLCILVLLFMPLIVPTNSRNYVMRCISYYFFFQLLLIPSGCNADHEEEDDHLHT